MSKSTYKSPEDFGFSTFDYDSMVQEKNSLKQSVVSSMESVNALKQELTTCKKNLDEVVGIVMPLLKRLLETAEKPHIHWPNRGEIIGEMIGRIDKIRGKSA